jgi:predicted RNase H-like HicB family nuclease
MEDSQEIGEVSGELLVEGFGPDVSINDLKAYIHEAEEGGYWAEVPALPGCLTQGETLDEVVENINDAIQGWLSVQTRESLIAQGVRFMEEAPVTATSVDSPRRWPRVRTLELAA